MAAGRQRPPDQRQYLRKLGSRDVKQAGIGPDAVIGLDLVEVVVEGSNPFARTRISW